MVEYQIFKFNKISLIFFLCSIFVTTNCNAQIKEIIPIKNIIEKGYDNLEVKFTGYITKKISYKEFLVKDDSGEVKIEITPNMINQLTIIPNCRILASGKIDKDLNFITIEVNSIEILD